MKCCRGAEITEYALIMALVVLVSIPALIIMGEQLNSSYNDLNPTGKASELFALLGEGSASQGSPDGPSDGGPIATNTQLPDTTGGSAIERTSAPGYVPVVSLGNRESTLNPTLAELISQGLQATSADGILQSVSNGGASGTVTALAQDLEKLIDQMEASGEMTADEAGHFRALANQGHKIAEIEQIIEKAGIQQEGNSWAINDPFFTITKVQYNNMNVNVTQLGNTIAWPGGMPTDFYDRLYTGNIDASELPPGNELGTFIQLFQASQQMDVLKNNPTLHDYIYSMSSVVASTGDQVGSLEFKISDGLYESLAQPLSDKANQASANICTAGQNSSTGTSCQ